MTRPVWEKYDSAFTAGKNAGLREAVKRYQSGDDWDVFATACCAILALIDQPAPEVTVKQAAKVLLGAWRNSQTIDADEIAQDHADIHECDVDYGLIVEPWLRALAGESHD